MFGVSSQFFGFPSHNSRRCFTGIDYRLWKQVQIENPDKDKFIPIPIIGFDGILWRTKCQEEQTKLHEALLEGISDDISSMQRVQVATNVKLNELKQRTLELEHRVLKVSRMIFTRTESKMVRDLSALSKKSPCNSISN